MILGLGPVLGFSIYYLLWDLAETRLFSLGCELAFELDLASFEIG